jgi:hypothetical protein
MPPPEDRRPALPPPQFRLSTLLWIVALVCAATAAMKFVGPLGAFALVLFAFLVLAHISGNAIGTRLRALGDQPVDEMDRPVPPPERGKVSLPVLAPRRLTQRQRLGLLLTLIVAAAIVAGAAGGAWWTLSSERNPSSQDIGLAAIAYGVLGGIWGLIGGGFLVAGVGAVREALQGARPPLGK